MSRRADTWESGVVVSRPMGRPASPTRVADPRLGWKPLAALFALCFGAYAYFYQAGGWNQNVRFDLTRAMVEDHSFVINRFARNTGDLALRNGRFYCDKAPGVSWLGVPAYAAAHAVAGQARPTPRFLAVSSWLSTLLAIALPSALAVVCFAIAVQALGLRAGPALTLAAAWGLATLAFPYSTVYYGHQLVAGLLIIAFALLASHRRGVQPSRRRSFLVGFVLGAAVVVEYPAALPGAIIFLYAVVAVPRRQLLWIIAGGLPPIIALAAYHHLAFGSPLTLPYEFSTQEHRHQGYFMGLGAVEKEALWGILFSEFRGLFQSMPWLLLAAPGALVMLWRRRFAEVAVCLAIVGVMIWLNASLVDWQGGWAMGPRYLIPAIPFLVVPIAGLVMPTVRWPILPIIGWVATAIAAAYSAFLMLAGVSVKVEVPSDVLRPFQQFLLPRFYAGDLAVSTQSIDMITFDDRGPRHAWNLGQVMGLDGLLSLIPLAVWVVSCTAILLVTQRQHASRGRDA